MDAFKDMVLTIRTMEDAKADPLWNAIKVEEKDGQIVVDVNVISTISFPSDLFDEHSAEQIAAKWKERIDLDCIDVEAIMKFAIIDYKDK